MAVKIVFILGAGPRIGAALASSFASKGYKIALASRSAEDGLHADGSLRVKLDLSDSSEVAGAFAKVKAAFGNVPNVVVYNAYARNLLDKEDPLKTLTHASVVKDFEVNSVSAVIAAQSAVSGFQELPDTLKKTFIYSGNLLAVQPASYALIFGMGKVAAWHMVETLTLAYGTRNYRFYYADQRNADGTSPGAAVDGPAHGECYTDLAEAADQLPWYFTFVKGQGYADFSVKR